MKYGIFRTHFCIALLTLALAACGGGGSANSSTNNSVVNSVNSSSVNSSNSIAGSSASNSVLSSAISSSSSSEDPRPIFTPPDLVNVTTLNLIQDQLIKLRLNNIGGKDLTECSSDLPKSFTTKVSSDATTCEISGNASDLINLTNFIVTAVNIGGSDSAQLPIQIQAATPFVTTWKTDNQGASEDNQITIATSPNFSYNYIIDWGDGSLNENVTGDITHTYALPGQYTVTITGTFPQPFFKATFDSTQTDSQKLLSVERWGNRAWRSMRQAFFDCRNLTINDTESPDLSLVTSMSSMFTNADKLSGNISNWDVSNVSDMENMFNGADNFNLDISGWDVSNAHNMSGMFGFTRFNQPLGLWNVSNVTNMNSMFRGALLFNQDISQWNTSRVSNMNAMFREARAFNQPIGNWDVANVTDTGDMFFATDLFNADISNWNMSKVNNMSRMFRGTKAFNQNLGKWDVSNVTNMSELFVAGVLSTENYDAILIGWSQRPSLKTGVVLNAETTKFSANAQIARDTLINNFGWVITDSGLTP